LGKEEIVTWLKLYPTTAREVPQRLMKLIGGFKKYHGVCGNNCKLVSSVKNLLAKAGKFRLNMNFLLPSWKRIYNGKQAAEGKQYVFIFYLNPEKHTSTKWQTKFLKSS